MKTIKQSLFSLFLLFTVFSLSAPIYGFVVITDISSKSLPEKMNAQVEQYVEKEDFHGTILVAQRGKILFKKAYGLADREKKIKHQIETQFQIGSLTKSFVAVVAMQMVEQGLLDLKAPIKKYIPDLKDELANGLTLHHLLKNQSGLIQGFDDLTNYENRDVTPNELLQIINKSKRDFAPGEQFQYSNLGFTLVAIAMENVTKKPFPQILQERIFKPLKMKNSGVERISNYPKGRAKGYRKTDNVLKNEENVVSYALGAGDIYSTAEDLYKWGKALYGGKLISEKSCQIIFDGGTKDWGYYGYGFRIQPYQRSLDSKSTGILTRHGGTMDGFISNFHHYLDDDLTIIFLSNYRNIPIRKMTFELKEIALGVEVGARNQKELE
jgi:CubicO group peptidase (beta-lactamase class C family)